jgi:serine/threonine protein kinase
MPLVEGQGQGCLSESGVVGLIGGRLPDSERCRVDVHLAHCDRCMLLVGEAMRGSDSASAQPAAFLRPPVLSPGMLIADRYHVRRLLGTGAMGEVHEVEDSLLGTVVALKTLNAGLAGDAIALARLRREVAAARRVTHPNVCRIFDLGTDAPGSFMFLTMEYLPGVTLSRHLRVHGSLPPAVALPLLLQLADGLAAAHAAEVIHRDLKSDNIMLVEQADGSIRPVIMDFGLASFVVHDNGGLERDGGFSGTLAYAAPERLLGAPATAASDAYSFGLIATEMLTNRRPDAGSRVDLAGHELPPDWRRILETALAPDPRRRFPHGGSVADALRKLDGASRSTVRRSRTAIAAAIVAAAIAGAAINLSAGDSAGRTQVAPAVASVPTLSTGLGGGLATTVAVAPPEQFRGTRSSHTRRRFRPTSESFAEPSRGQAARTDADDLIRSLRFPAVGKQLSVGSSGEDLVNPFANRGAEQVRQ